MNLHEIETLVALADVARVSEITVRANGRRITIRKNPPAPQRPGPVKPTLDLGTVAPTVPAIQAKPPVPVPREEVILAPMVGIFHSVEPYLSAGSHVESGQVVGTIESMRLMNDLSTEISGEVHAILVEDGMAVEYGQPILRIRVADPADDGDFGV
jgi:acetyl-CoA carboxylase biotin carboxyl carrier protein